MRNLLTYENTEQEKAGTGGSPAHAQTGRTPGGETFVVWQKEGVSRQDAKRGITGTGLPLRSQGEPIPH